MYVVPESNSEIDGYLWLKKKKEEYWQGLSDTEYKHLFNKFKWLWTDSRIKSSREKGSLTATCNKKISYLNSLIDAI